MTVSHDVRAQIDKIDDQILDLLAERIALSQEAMDESDEEEGLGMEYEAGVVARFEDEAEERGWSPSVLGSLARFIIKLCKSAES